MIKTLIVLPDKYFDVVFWEQTKKHIKHHFNVKDYYFLCASDVKKDYINIFTNLIVAQNNPIQLEAELKRFKDLKNIIILYNADGTSNSVVYKKYTNIDIYNNYMQGYGGLRKILIDEKDEPVFPIKKDHHFYKISQTSNDNLIFFPYLNFSHRNSKFGVEESNDCGFRVPSDLEYVQNRNPNTKLIVFTGGSACFGYSSFIGERFTDELQEMINRNNKLKHNYIVLNFAFEGHMLINEMITYLLFIMKLKPEYLISFSLLNDLVMSSVSDPLLLKNHSIGYQFYLENMASRVSGNNKSLPWERRNRYPLSTTQTVVRATYERLIQFKTIVENNGSKFISIMQPLVYSKKRIAK
ncbi:hypothetical protein OAH16_00830, partial [bacterium]|nr:hypothetical protein [bacterium]